MRQRVAVVGAGGMGSAVAAYLARSGQDVVLVGRGSAHVRRLLRSDLQVRPPDGPPWTVRVPVAVRAADLSPGSVDVAVFLTKAFDTAAAATAVAPALAAEGVAVSLQNGLGNDAVLAGVFGGPRSLVGTTTIGATLQEPGLVSVSRSTAAGASRTHVGVLGPAAAGHRVADTVALLVRAGLPAEAPAHVALPIWEKLALAVMSPVSAVLRMTVAQVMARPDAQDLVRRMFDEVVTVGVAQGVPVEREPAWAYAASVFAGTGEHHTSMCTDVMHGRRTELDTMAGAVRRLAADQQIPVPVHDTIVPLLRALGA